MVSTEPIFFFFWKKERENTKLRYKIFFRIYKSIYQREKKNEKERKKERKKERRERNVGPKKGVLTSEIILTFSI